MKLDHLLDFVAISFESDNNADLSHNLHDAKLSLNRLNNMNCATSTRNTDAQTRHCIGSYQE